MKSLELGLEVVFYLYPVGLFATLFSAQLVSFRYRKVASARAPAVDERDAEKIRRFYARIFWCLQFLLTPLLVSDHCSSGLLPSLPSNGMPLAIGDRRGLTHASLILRTAC